MPRQLTGAIAAALTPLTDGGAQLDDTAFGPMLDFLAAAGVDGVLAMGTTGEGILLDRAERRRALQLFIQAASGRLSVAAHCGAQTTADTTALAAASAELGADAVAVIGPPYFALDEASLLHHFAEAARACAPLPFYVYEFAARSGYQVPIPVLDRLRSACPNFTGLKVSDSPWERFEPYLLDGLDIFVGPESLISRGMERGAIGAVSALASAFPELVVDAVRTRTLEASELCAAVRDSLQSFPFQSALKLVLAHRGVPVREDVRAPLRTLSAAERTQLDALLPGLVAGIRAAAG